MNFNFFIVVVKARLWTNTGMGRRKSTGIIARLIKEGTFFELGKNYFFSLGLEDVQKFITFQIK